MTESIHLRPATPGDATTIAALATQVFLDTYTTHGVRPDLAREAFHHYSPAAFESRLAEAQRRFILAEEGDGLAGFAEVLCVSRAAPAGGMVGAELVRLYVQPAYQGAGLGRKLIREAERLAAESAAPCLWLTAWDGNLNAIAFYSRMGYEDVGETTYSFEGNTYGNRVLARPTHASPSETMRNYYAARAREYDQVYAKPERQRDLRAIEMWLPTVFGDAEVLEVACGTGYWTQFIAPRARGVLAIDASRETLDIARSRENVGNVRFVVGDAYALPVGPRTFRACFAGFWISHVPLSRLGAFLHELRRTLQPGAKVVLLDNRYVEGSSTPVSGEDAEGNTWQTRTLADGSTHRVLKNFPTEAGMRRALEGVAGDVRFHQWQFYWAVEYVSI